MKRGAWKKWSDAIKENTYALYLASRDQRIPVLAKIVIGMVVAYALSPIDLIPDFIPVIGHVDDLFLLPIGIWLAIQLIPDDVWWECQVLAKAQVSELPRNRRAAAIIVMIWLVIIVGFILWIRAFVSSIKST